MLVWHTNGKMKKAFHSPFIYTTALCFYLHTLRLIFNKTASVSWFPTLLLCFQNSVTVNWLCLVHLTVLAVFLSLSLFSISIFWLYVLDVTFRLVEPTGKWQVRLPFTWPSHVSRDLKQIGVQSTPSPPSLPIQTRSLHKVPCFLWTSQNGNLAKKLGKARVEFATQKMKEIDRRTCEVSNLKAWNENLPTSEEFIFI